MNKLLRSCAQLFCIRFLLCVGVACSSHHGIESISLCFVFSSMPCMYIWDISLDCSSVVPLPVSLMQRVWPPIILIPNLDLPCSSKQSRINQSINQSFIHDGWSPHFFRSCSASNHPITSSSFDHSQYSS
mmetsp:Transcript_36044/g.87115  ORF Transcript_36044/g.87115 Transcript_36044/m.87115 type:complete len:130 (-) Transcript_36044:927-1316(-)